MMDVSIEKSRGDSRDYFLYDFFCVYRFAFMSGIRIKEV